MSRSPPSLRFFAVFLSEVFAVTTLCIMRGQFSRMLMSLVTCLLILLPELLQRLFRCRISLPLYLFALFYALGPMLGHCYNFYFRIPHWDKLLHILGGIIFVIFGSFLFSVLGGDSKKFVCIAFAFCFSVAVSVLWEFFEFGMDRVFSMDMQSDSVVSQITSYVINSASLGPGTIEGICTVSVNGQCLPCPGYLDIGLYDTMADMLLETAGALLTCIYFLCSKGQHRLIAPM